MRYSKTVTTTEQAFSLQVIDRKPGPAISPACWSLSRTSNFLGIADWALYAQFQKKRR